MMHDFPRTFSLPQDRQERAAAHMHPPLTPAAYLRLRRESAGMSISAVALMIAPNRRDIAPARDLVRMLEIPGNTARHHDTLDRLQAAFPFDPSVYRQLAEDPADRHPRVCRGCGCSEYDRGAEGAWDWATNAACTRCLHDVASDMERAA